MKSFAQPTLTAVNSNPVAGEMFVYHHLVFDNSVYSQLSVRGAGVTWDFSGVTETGADTDHVVSCGSTPNCGLFSGSNIALVKYFQPNIYAYLNANANSFTAVGSYMDTNNIQIFSDGYDFLHFPFTYLDYFSDSFSYTVQGVSSSIGFHVDTAESYGTLILPSGTFNNVLRIRSDRVQTDSDFTTHNTAISGNENYYWYAPNYHCFLFHYQTYGGNSSAAYTTISAATGVNEVTKTEQLQVFPNPNNGAFTIEFPAGNNEQAIISVTNAIGQKVKQLTTNTDKPLEVSLNEPAGLYFLIVKTSLASYSSKIILNR